MNGIVTVAIYQLVLGRSIPYRQQLPGAVIMGVGAWGLTLIGGLYVQRVIARMTSVFGPFASTIGLFAYVSLMIQIFVFATEVNVVRSKRSGRARSRRSSVSRTSGRSR